MGSLLDIPMTPWEGARRHNKPAIDRGNYLSRCFAVLSETQELSLKHSIFATGYVVITITYGLQPKSRRFLLILGAIVQLGGRRG